MLKAIVFDFDGVIVNSEPLHYRAFLRVAKPLGLAFSYDEYLARYIGYDDRDAFRVMLGLQAGVPGSPQQQEQIAQLIEEKANAFEAVVDEGIDTIPGMVDLVEEAAASMPIAIASGATRRDITLILDKLGLTDRFLTIVSADVVDRSKPDPASYSLAIRRLHELNPLAELKPRDCLSIEDTAAGIESARGAGLKTLGLATSCPASALHRANRVIDSAKGLTLTQLREWFED